MKIRRSDEPPLGYVLITFDQEAAITGGDLIIDIGTNCSTVVVGVVISELYKGINQEDDGGTAEH